MSNRTSSVLVLSCLVSACAAPDAPAQDQTSSELLASAQSIAVPAYFDEWGEVLDEVPPVALIVANPASGPGPAQEAEYVQSIADAHAAGVKVVGYVDTDYGTIHPDIVKGEIDDYYDWYEIDGIFFDQTDDENCSLASSYYAPLYTYLKNKDAGAILVHNPGSDIESCYLSTADIFATFENTADSYINDFSTDLRAWETPANADRVWHIVHTASTESEMLEVLELSQERNAGLVWVGIDTYSQLPPYWEAEAAAVRAFNDTLGSGGGDFHWLRASNTATTNTYRFEFDGTYQFLRAYLDTDANPATGFDHCGIGADYLIENTTLRGYTGDGDSWSWSNLGGITSSLTATSATWTVARSSLGETAYPNTADVCFEGETESDDIHTAPAYRHAYSDESGPVHAYFAENDASTIRYQATFDTSYAQKHVFIDTDGSSGTGYSTGGIGADFMVENGTLYDYTGSGGAWGWTSIGSASMVPSTAGATGVTTWTIARSSIGETAGSGETSRLVFHGRVSGGASEYAAPVYQHAFGP